MKLYITPEETESIFKLVKSRFEKNRIRHQGIDWERIKNRLLARPEKIWSLNQMELTGGEPDVVGQDAQTGEYIFFDCSQESPKGEGVFVMTQKHWHPERNISLKTLPWEWQQRWVLIF